MKGALIAVIGVVAVVVTMTAAAVAGTAGGQRGDGSGSWMRGMLSSASADGSGWRQAPEGWMHGSAVGSEFAYLAEMVAHHEEAVAAAQELQRSTRLQMRAFGAAIVQTQSAQIDLMTAWLTQWYPGRSTEVDYEPMMRDLSGLAGDELDQAFPRGHDRPPHGGRDDVPTACSRRDLPDAALAGRLVRHRWVPGIPVGHPAQSDVVTRAGTLAS